MFLSRFYDKIKMSLLIRDVKMTNVTLHSLVLFIYSHVVSM